MPETTVISLRGRIRELGPSLELPAAAHIVYCGRAMYMGGWRLPASPWANPFTVKQAGSAQRAVDLYVEWLPTQPQLLARVPELRGKPLGCWCAPRPCHAAALAALATGGQP
jgi:hypothetical protein